MRRSTFLAGPMGGYKMIARKKKEDKSVREIRNLLERNYLTDHPDAKVDVYRYNSASIRIRVIDPAFSGLGLTERDSQLWAILDRLPEDTLTQINLLLCLSPKELARSMMNAEFE